MHTRSKYFTRVKHSLTVDLTELKQWFGIRFHCQDCFGARGELQVSNITVNCLGVRLPYPSRLTWIDLQHKIRTEMDKGMSLEVHHRLSVLMKDSDRQPASALPVILLTWANEVLRNSQWGQQATKQDLTVNSTSIEWKLTKNWRNWTLQCVVDVEWLS